MASAVELLECTVCLNLPCETKSIYQCCNGHLICTECRLRLRDGRCPYCRVEYGETPIKCLLAQKQLKVLAVSCKNEGCVTRLIKVNLKKIYFWNGISISHLMDMPSTLGKS